MYSIVLPRLSMYMSLYVIKSVLSLSRLEKVNYDINQQDIHGNTWKNNGMVDQ